MTLTPSIAAQMVYACQDRTRFAIQTMRVEATKAEQS